MRQLGLDASRPPAPPPLPLAALANGSKAAGGRTEFCTLCLKLSWLVCGLHVHWTCMCLADKSWLWRLPARHWPWGSLPEPSTTAWAYGTQPRRTPIWEPGAGCDWPGGQSP